MATEEALEVYSPLELESWVLQRRSADWEWQSKSHPVHQRVISLDDNDIDTLTLVPGGRWLLTVMCNGSVLCHDLEDPQMRSNLLTPPRDDPHGLAIYCVAVDIDHTSTSPTSRFLMVNYPSEYTSRSLIGSLDLMIWSVNLRGHGSSAYLEAHLLHSFPATEPTTNVLSVSLSYNLLARLMSTPQFRRTYIEIFDWRSSTASVHRRTVIFPRDPDFKYSVSVLLLPGSRLAFVSYHNVFIYDIGTITEEQPIVPIMPQSSSQPRWVSSGDHQFRHRQSSQDNEAVVLVLTSNQTVYHLMIPHNVEHLPHLVPYMNLPHKYYMYAAGTQKALVRKEDSFLIKIGITHHPHPGIVTAHQLNDTPYLPFPLRYLSSCAFLLAEDIGRIVIRLKRGIFILETSRFPKFVSC